MRGYCSGRNSPKSLLGIETILPPAVAEVSGRNSPKSLLGIETRNFNIFGLSTGSRNSPKSLLGIETLIKAC